MSGKRSKQLRAEFRAFYGRCAMRARVRTGNKPLVIAKSECRAWKKSGGDRVGFEIRMGWCDVRMPKAA